MKNLQDLYQWKQGGLHDRKRMYTRRALLDLCQDQKVSRATSSSETAIDATWALWGLCLG